MLCPRAELLESVDGLYEARTGTNKGLNLVISGWNADFILTKDESDSLVEFSYQYLMDKVIFSCL